MLTCVRVLFVKQDHASPGGLVGDAFDSLGYDVSEFTVVPAERYQAPDVAAVFPSPGDYDAIVYFGAAWSVYDSATIGTWVGDEIALARSAHALGVPQLGICFGGQMLAAALGGSVARAPVPEIGWYTMETVAAGGPGFAPGLGLVDAGPWFQWHVDRFTVPDPVPVLARSAAADQAFCWGRTLGLQFHPELTPSVLECWLSVGGTEQLAGLGVDAAALMERTRALAPGAAGRTRELVRRFVTDVTRRPPVPLPNATVVTPSV
jgi:GMP synthase-like glutamine amidotransferase